MNQSAPLLQLESISKQYPGCLANDNVSLTIQPGEIHALLGENGAGKSTLVKMIYGLLKPSAGTIIWKGQEVSVDGPSAARKLGICMVFQHFSVFDALNVAENIALGLDEYIPERELHEKIVQVSESYGLPLEPKRLVHTLSVGERQRIEIVRSLLQNPQLLIMDEPTSVLTPQEVHALFKTLRKLKEEGCAILYISHKLDEIKQLCETATILRDGKVVAKCSPGQESAQSLARLMIGETPEVVSQPPEKTGDTIFSVCGLSRRSTEPFGTHLKDIRISLKAGEILGIAGVAGNGQAELLSALSGETRTSPEIVQINMVACGHLSPVARRELGLAFVPEDRLGHGAVPSMSLVDNTLLSGYKKQKLTSHFGIDIKAARQIAQNIRKDFNVKSSGIGDEAQSLSGGNLQKFIVGREISQKPKVFVLGQPTWGVDAGSAAAIHQAIIELAENGTAVLIVSQDLDELLILSHKIAVISHGALSPFQPVSEVDAESLGMLMGASNLQDLQASAVAG